VYRIGASRPAVRRLAGTGLGASSLLSIWIWDIPWTGRIICEGMHDGRAALRTRHLYLVVLVAIVCALIVEWRRRARPASWTSQPWSGGAR
jgi:hypothetical protein